MRPFPRLETPYILAPMAGVTDVALRVLCKRYGAGLTLTEFLSSEGLRRNSERVWREVRRGEHERPFGVQLFGSSIEAIVEAARAVAPHCDLIDLNLGCPAWKVVRGGAGSALLGTPEKVHAIVLAVASAVPIPVSVKIRSGTAPDTVNAVEVAKACEAAGAAMVTVHPRTASQGFSGTADWSIIRQVKQAVGVPVCGNGDVWSAEDAHRMRHETGCDFVMIGRAAMADPRIFAEITGKEAPADKRGLIGDYLALAEAYRIPFAAVKGHLIQFTKGLEGGAKLRETLSKAFSLGEAMSALNASGRLMMKESA